MKVIQGRKVGMFQQRLLIVPPMKHCLTGMLLLRQVLCGLGMKEFISSIKTNSVRPRTIKWIDDYNKIMVIFGREFEREPGL